HSQTEGHLGRATIILRRCGVSGHHRRRSVEGPLVQGSEAQVGTATSHARLHCMFTGSAIEESFNIAWGFLEKSGELVQPDASANILLDLIERQIRAGERRKLILANRAIAAFREDVGQIPRRAEVVWIS